MPTKYEQIIQELKVQPMIPEARIFELFKIAAVLRPTLRLDQPWNKNADTDDFVAKALHEKYTRGYRGISLAKAFSTKQSIEDVILQSVPEIAMEKRIHDKRWEPVEIFAQEEVQLRTETINAAPQVPALTAA